MNDRLKNKPALIFASLATINFSIAILLSLNIFNGYSAVFFLVLFIIATTAGYFRYQTREALVGLLIPYSLMILLYNLIAGGVDFFLISLFISLPASVLAAKIFKDKKDFITAQKAAFGKLHHRRVIAIDKIFLGVAFVGACWLATALSMSTTSSTLSDCDVHESQTEKINCTDQNLNQLINGRGSVTNLKKQNDRNINIVLACLTILVSVILFLSSKRARKKSERSLRRQDLPHSFDPSDSLLTCDRDLQLSAYRIWLVSKYSITKNEVLGGYVCNRELFTSADEALEHAHSLELQLLNLDKQPQG